MNTNIKEARLDSYVAEKYGISRVLSKELIECNTFKVLHDNTELHQSKIKPSLKMSNTERYLVEPFDSLSFTVKVNNQITKNNIAPLANDKIDIKVLFEDQYLAVIEKPAGISTHSNFDDNQPSLVNGLISLFGFENLAKTQDPLRSGIVHRLDKNTSGLMLIAKTQESLTALQAIFKERKIKKCYKAICYGVPRIIAGVIDTGIEKSKNDRTKMTISNSLSSKQAITHYKLNKVIADGLLSVIDCRIDTGRTHQIRVHLTHLGNSVVGDETYGVKNDKWLETRFAKYPETLLQIKSLNRHLLHATHLSFIHPFLFTNLSFDSKLPFCL